MKLERGGEGRMKLEREGGRERGKNEIGGGGG